MSPGGNPGVLFFVRMGGDDSSRTDADASGRRPYRRCVVFPKARCDRWSQLCSRRRVVFERRAVPSGRDGSPNRPPVQAAAMPCGRLRGGVPTEGALCSESTLCSKVRRVAGRDGSPNRPPVQAMVAAMPCGRLRGGVPTEGALCSRRRVVIGGVSCVPEGASCTKGASRRR